MVIIFRLRILIVVDLISKVSIVSIQIGHDECFKKLSLKAVDISKRKIEQFEHAANYYEDDPFFKYLTWNHEAVSGL